MSLLSPQLQAFIAVAQAKTVHGAAHTLYLTQTAVTQRIRTLEASLKTTLFIRTRRGMQLTQEGLALLRYCQASKQLEGEALAMIHGAGVETELELTITAPSSIMSSRVIPNCLPVMDDYPNLLIRFDVDDIELRHQKLKSGLSDLTIIREQDLTLEMQYKKLAPEHNVLVASYAWKGRSLKDIIKNERIIDYDPTDQMTFDYLKHYDLFDYAQHGRYFVNRSNNLALLIMQGAGYSVLTKEFAQPYVEDKQLLVLNHAKSHKVQSVLAWFHRPESPGYFANIVDAIV